MNILILVVTGRVGSQIVTHALHDGHDVTVLVRNPEKIQINTQISVSDTAEFTFGQINSSDYIESRVGIAY
ncbi:NAD(P)H-binding protein [Priestia megaterium]|uniref:NAD(P)H-binding protein n=1 Tax=Priestia megaterium TaxID=1404 RepID=UPI003100CAF1